MNEYFISPVHELIFYLRELDGEARLDKLGITKFHYHNKAYAEKWYEDKMRILSSGDHLQLTKAQAELHYLYRRMTV